MKYTGKKVNCIIVSGPAGSGKSTIGMTLSSKYGYTYLDKDTLSNDFVEKTLKDNGSYVGDRESEFYKRVINPIEYDILAESAIENLSLGNSVVLSAPFLEQLKQGSWFNEKLIDVFGKDYVNLKFVWIHTDRDTDKKRLKDRGLTRDKWKLDNWSIYCENMKSYDPNLIKEDLYIFDNRLSINQGMRERLEPLYEWLEN